MNVEVKTLHDSKFRACLPEGRFFCSLFNCILFTSSFLSLSTKLLVHETDYLPVVDNNNNLCC